MYCRGTLSAEYAYAATNLQGSCLRGGEKERIPNTFKEAMSLPKAAYWKEAADKEIQSLEKHGVYELVPMSFVPSSQKVVGTRWVNKMGNGQKWVYPPLFQTEVGGGKMQTSSPPVITPNRSQSNTDDVITLP